MKVKVFLSIIFFQFIGIFTSYSQVIDTLVDVNGHKLHFTIWKGSGIPILFESGGGDDSRVWESILEPISKITGATLITYDREGFGKSTVNLSDTAISKHRIEDGIINLEIGLKKLGFNKDIMLVSHSYGGYYSSLYAYKHPNLVKSIVLIDVNHKFVDKFIDELWLEWEPGIKESKKNNNLGMYFMGANIKETIKTNNSISIPNNIPIVDLVSEFTPHQNMERVEYWRKTHEDFVKNHPNRIGLTANDASHFIWQDKPNLVIMTIAKSYAETQKEKKKISIYEQILKFATNVINEKKHEITIRVTVPKETNELYITGNQDVLGNWNPQQVMLKKVSENVREIKLRVYYPFEFKFTMGNWEKEAIIEGLLKTEHGFPNLKINEDKKDNFEYVIKSWIESK